MSQSFSTFAKKSWALPLLLVLFLAGCGSPEDRAQRHYERGEKLLSQNEYVKAALEFKNALQLKKDFVDAWRGLATIEAHKPNADKRTLIPILATIVELDRTDVESRVQLARRLFETNALDATHTALNHLETAIELNPQHAAALAVKAGILLRLDDREGAIRDATAALAVDPTNPEAIMVIATDHLKRSDTEGALQIIDSQPAAHATNIPVQILKILALQKKGDQQGAEMVLRRLIEAHPQHASLRQMMVRYYVRQKRTDEAENELRVWAAANPDEVERGLDVVRFLRVTKGTTAARQELLSRINTVKQPLQYQLALAELHAAEGQLNESIKLLEKIVAGANPSDANSARLKMAELQLRLREPAAAEALIAEVLRKDNRNVGALKLRASIRLARGEVDAAISDARQALAERPRATDVMALLASAYERNGSMELAEKQYADATKVSAYDPGAGIRYVGFLQRRGHIDRAEDILRELANRSPRNLQVLAALAQVRLKRRNWVGAEEIAQRIRQIGSDQGLSDQIQGVVLAGRNRLHESVSTLEKAYAQQSDSVDSLATLIDTMMEAQEFDRAANFLQKVLERNPKNSYALVLLGQVQLRKNAEEEALKSFQAAIDRQPNNAVGYEALADFHTKRGNFDEAINVVRAGLQQRPDNFGRFALRLVLAGLLYARGDYEGALSEYESMLKAQPDSMIVANNIASLLSDYRSDKQNIERAYSIAGILRKSPVPQFKDTLGWLEYKRGDYRSAVPLLEQAAAELPDDAGVHYHLGTAYIAAGQIERGAEQLQTALKLAPKGGELEAKIRSAQQKAAM